jgi:hypothetical protein
LLRCASCGRALVGEVHTKRSGKSYVYYRCHRRGQARPCTEPTMPERVLLAQIAADLARTQLAPEAARWIRDNLAATLKAEGAQLASIRQSVELALRQAQTEEETLLSLRLRGSIDDETFERRRAELGSRRVQLEVRVARPAPTIETLLQRVDAVVGFAQNAPTFFTEGTPVQQRQILETIGSNYRVTARKALYEAKKPFTFFEATGSNSDWCTIAEDVRTWLLKDSQDCWIPSLDGGPARDVVTEHAYG